jgi:hypothetical protein
MAYKYKINDFLFENIDNKVSYLLGLIWSDGYVGKQGIRITSNDIEFLKDIPTHFNMTAPVYLRKGSNAGDLVFNSKHYKSQLLKFGFHNQKSKFGKPIINDAYFSDFLRGVFDGDGTICNVKNQLRIYIATNKDAGEYIKQKINSLVGIDITLIERKIVKEISINGRRIINNNVCRILQTKNTNDANILMEYIYRDCGDLHLKRKSEIYNNWKIKYENNKTVVCLGCGNNFVRHSTTDAYCENCRVIKRRCQNRRQDMFSRKRTHYLPLNLYRKDNELFCDLERDYFKNKQIIQQLKQVAKDLK